MGATLKFCNVEFNMSYTNVIDFSTEDLKEQYFNDRTNYTITNNQLVKKNDKTIVIKRNIFQINENYICVINTGKDNNEIEKLYFFITDIRYNTPDSSYVDIMLDYWQTYMSTSVNNLILENYIERQHVDRWNGINPIWNTIPEDLNLSLNHIKDIKNISDGNSICFICFVIVDENSFNLGIKAYDYSGNKEIWVKLNSGEQNITFNIFSNISSTYIKNAYIIPYNFSKSLNIEFDSASDKYYISSNKISTINVDGVGYCIDFFSFLYSKDDRIRKIYSINKITRPNNYSKDNNRNIIFETKIYTSQFTVNKIMNKNINFNINNEEIQDNTSLYYIASPSLNREIYYYLENYRDGNFITNTFTDNSQSQIFTISNTEQQYIASNQNTITTTNILGFMSALINGGLLLAMPQTAPFTIPATIGGLVGGIGGVAKNYAGISDKENTPENVVTSSNGFVDSIVYNGSKLSYCTFQPQEDKLYAAYDYLYMFGYKYMKVEKPDLNSRYYFNYIKTIGLNISNNIPMFIYDIIKDIFENGVRIWHYRDRTFKFLNYEKENIEVSQI